MADPERFLRFEHQHRDGLHFYVIRADEADLPGPAWSGLWEQDYPEDPGMNPWQRHGINNNDGEALAVWRALAWALTAGRSRFAIPAYYRDEAAQLLGARRRIRSRSHLRLAVAGTGSVGTRPRRVRRPVRAGQLPRHHQPRLGRRRRCQLGTHAVRPLRSSPGRFLVASLNQTDRPYLAKILQPGDIFVDLAVRHDLGTGASSYLTVKAAEGTEEVGQLADHFSRAFRRYLDRVSQIRTFEEFHAAIDDLLALPDVTHSR